MGEADGEPSAGSVVWRNQDYSQGIADNFM
jgi:hypothetical protein